MTIPQSASASLLVLIVFLIFMSILEGLLIRTAAGALERMRPWDSGMGPKTTISVPMALGIGFTCTLTRLFLAVIVWAGFVVFVAWQKLEPSLVEDFASATMWRLIWFVQPLVIMAMAETTLLRAVVLSLITAALAFLIGAVIYLGMWQLFILAPHAFSW